MSDFDFKRNDTPTIMDGQVVRYQSGYQDYFQISASRNGVLVFNLPKITTMEELEIVFSFLKRAYLQHCQLRKNGTTLSEGQLNERLA